MTVEEFIAVLSRFPKDAQVIYQCCSEFEVLHPDDPGLVTAADAKIILRNGRYMRSFPGWHTKGEADQWVTVVTLPGN